MQGIRTNSLIEVYMADKSNSAQASFTDCPKSPISKTSPFLHQVEWKPKAGVTHSFLHKPQQQPKPLIILHPLWQLFFTLTLSLFQLFLQFPQHWDLLNQLVVPGFWSLQVQLQVQRGADQALWTKGLDWRLEEKGCVSTVRRTVPTTPPRKCQTHHESHLSNASLHTNHLYWAWFPGCLETDTTNSRKSYR